MGLWSLRLRDPWFESCHAAMLNYEHTTSQPDQTNGFKIQLVIQPIFEFAFNIRLNRQAH